MTWTRKPNQQTPNVKVSRIWAADLIVSSIKHHVVPADNNYCFVFSSLSRIRKSDFVIFYSISIFSQHKKCFHMQRGTIRQIPACPCCFLNSQHEIASDCVSIPATRTRLSSTDVGRHKVRDRTLTKSPSLAVNPLTVFRCIERRIPNKRRRSSRTPERARGRPDNR
jgi:hypothetical protein